MISARRCSQHNARIGSQFKSVVILCSTCDEINPKKMLKKRKIPSMEGVIVVMENDVIIEAQFEARPLPWIWERARGREIENVHGSQPFSLHRYFY